MDINLENTENTEKTIAHCTCPECTKRAESSIGDTEYWKAAGQFFGYPDCCIEEFLVNASTMTPTTGVRAQVANYGFVPCEKHSREILAGTIKHLPLDAPRWAEPYNDLLLKQAVASLIVGIPTEFVRSAINFVHRSVGRESLEKCKKAYEEFHSTSSTTDSE
jgi:hypothetical protein